MFAYCLNNSVRYKDTQGYIVTDCYDTDGEMFSSDELDERGGGGGGNTNTSVVQGPPLNGTTSNNSYNFTGAKGVDYANKRNWTHTNITEAINDGIKGKSTNRSNGAECDVYLYPGSTYQYVVIESSSRAIVQLSDFNNSGWLPDTGIIWFSRGYLYVGETNIFPHYTGNRKQDPRISIYRGNRG